MLNPRFWITIRTATLLALASGLVPACGGTAVLPSDGVGASTSAGASGSGSGGSSSGGASGFGAVGGTSCADVACLAIGCGDGYKTVLLPGDCCSSCVPDGSGGAGGGDPCAGAACPSIACAPGYKYQSTPGMCCGTCVPDDQACSVGQAGYKMLREGFLADPKVHSCEKAADCKYLETNVFCGDACLTQPVNAAAAVEIEQQLSQFAANYCSSCTPLQPPCPAPLPPACVQGQCSFGVFY
jgi:hypothetical protein